MRTRPVAAEEFDKATLPNIAAQAPSPAKPAAIPAPDKTVATLVDVHGETFLLTEIDPKSSPNIEIMVALAGGYSEYGMLSPRLNSLERVIRAEASKMVPNAYQFIFRDGLIIYGRVRGMLKGKSNTGLTSIEWNNIKELNLGTEQPVSKQAETHQSLKTGAEASVTLKSQMVLKLSHLNLWYTYRQDNRVGYTATMEAIPFVIAGNAEVDIPFSLIDKLTSAKEIGRPVFTANVWPNLKSSLDISTGAISAFQTSDGMQVDQILSGPYIHGEDDHGGWAINVAFISHMQFSRANDTLDAPKVALGDSKSTVTWQNRTMTIRSAYGSVSLNKGSGTIENDIHAIASVRSTRLTSNKNEDRLTIVMRDGSTLEGTGNIKATISAIDEFGLHWVLKDTAIEAMNLLWRPWRNIEVP